MHLDATPEERAQRDRVMRAIVEAIREGVTIRLPEFDPDRSVAGAVAMQTVGIEPNPFGGAVGEFRYQFEGEEDLLHLMVARRDLAPAAVEHAQAVAQFLMPDVPPALIWIRPGETTQHFYLGHDVLLEGK